MRFKRPAFTASRFGSPSAAAGTGGLSRRAATGSPSRAPARWALWGALAGALVAFVAFAPAAWLAELVARGSAGHVLLADAQGTLWNGHAVAVLTGGAGSRDARALPGRLHWRIRPDWRGLQLSAEHACCLNESLRLRLQPGIGTLRAVVSGRAGWSGQWPAGFLTGLGTPWNTLDLSGALRLVLPQDLTLDWVQGRWRLDGQVQVELLDVSSRLASVPRLGSYRLDLRSQPGAAGTAQLQLSTLDGALLLSGDGSFGPAGLRLRGEASAREGDQAALSNLLNIIGRRSGARAIIAIG
jgi:general secretion pathway protein N